MNNPTRSQTGGIATILVVAMLLAVAFGLYLQLVMRDETPEDVTQVSESAVSVQVLEGDEPAPPDAPAAATAQPLPDDQMAILMKVFAPESKE